MWSLDECLRKYLDAHHELHCLPHPSSLKEQPFRYLTMNSGAQNVSRLGLYATGQVTEEKLFVNERDIYCSSS